MTNYINTIHLLDVYGAANWYYKHTRIIKLYLF